MRKGQSALEYLSTYSWAVLITLTAMAALYYFGVVNPVSLLPTSCSMPADFACYGYKLDTSGYLTLDLLQSTGHDIAVTRLKCVEGLDPEMDSSHDLPSEVVILNGAHETLSDGTVQCYYEGGDPVSGDPGEAFKGHLFIEYYEIDTNFTHVLTGDLVAKLE